MSNSQRSSLAKLMATENILVEHKNVPTASFNTKHRVLNLPIWKDASKDVYDLLVGHEVAHALHTPVDWSAEAEVIDPDNARAVTSYLNVVEDARIEKMIKRKFPGLRKNMFKGYAELLEKNFFGTIGRSLDSYKLIDRLNLHFKVGNHITIPFSDDELEIIKRIENLDSYDDVINCVRDIYSGETSETDKDEVETPSEDFEESDDLNDDDDSNDYSDDDTELENEEISDSPSKSEDSDNEEISDESSSSFSDNDDRVEESETQTSFNDALDEERDDYAQDRVYAKVPFLNSDPYVVPLKNVHTQIALRNSKMNIEDLAKYKEKFSKFNKDSAKTVNYLAKEFEIKKNAEQHARASISKTGVIDTNKIHSYKISDDIFRRVTSIPGGKNHGLVMFVDWSGSMTNDMGNTIRQTMILAMFCRKVNIPFDVYSFTDGCKMDDDLTPDLNSGDLTLGKIRLRHYLSSDMKVKEFNETLFNFFILAEKFDGNVGYYIGSLGNDNLSSTPLNEAIILADDIYLKFKTKYRLEKVNVVFLTDGDANANTSVYNPDSTYGSDSLNLGWYYHDDNPTTFIVDSKTKNSIGISTSNELTDALIKHFADRNDTNVIGFFISDANIKPAIPTHIDPTNSMSYNDLEILKKKWRKEKCLVIDHRGYSKFFLIKGGKDFNSDTEEFEVAADASKAKIRSAFKKHLNSKLGNKIILNSFIDIIS